MYSEMRSLCNGLHTSSRISLGHNVCISNHPYQELVSIVYMYLPLILFLPSFSGFSGHTDPGTAVVLLWITVISSADILPLFPVQ